MRKIYFILLLLSSIVGISGQEIKETSDNSWSIALTYAPLTTFYYYHGLRNEYLDHYSIGITETIYPKGGNIMIDRKINDRLSFSSGFSMKTKKNEKIGLGADMLYYETSTENKYIFEIPVTIKYYFSNSPRFFSPYLNTGLRNTYFKRSYIGDFKDYTTSPWGTTGEIDKHEGKYFMFVNLGLGFDLKFYKSFSLILESNLTYSISGFGYLEGQGGIRYSFK
jgi:hypothetical protein